MSLRCVNCTLRLAKLRRHRLCDESDEIVERVRGWVYPNDVSSNDYICHTCWELLHKADQVDSTQVQLTPQSLGHHNVCIGCGRSILKTRSHFIIKPEMSDKDTRIANAISSWISPRQLMPTNKSCASCWLKAKKFAKSGIVTPDVSDPLEIQPSSMSPLLKSALLAPNPANRSNIETDKLNAYTEDTASLIQPSDLIKDDEPVLEHPSNSKSNPKPATLIRFVMLRNPPDQNKSTSQQSVSMTKDSTCNCNRSMKLPSIKRAADDTHMCLFKGCQNVERRNVPHILRRRIMKDFNFYIPPTTRICNYHLATNFFHELPSAENSLTTFTPQHIEEMIDLLKPDDKNIDLLNPEKLDDHLFRYWFGKSKPEYRQILAEIPELNAPHIKRGFHGLLYKMRTGSSDEKIADLFGMPRTTLSLNIKKAQEIMQDTAPIHLENLGQIKWRGNY